MNYEVVKNTLFYAPRLLVWINIYIMQIGLALYPPKQHEFMTQKMFFTNY